MKQREIEYALALGKNLAAEVNKVALDRITFIYGIAIEEAQVTVDQFSPLNPQPGVVYTSPGRYHLTGGNATFTRGLNAANIKEQLEQPTHPGEKYYGLLRSARQSGSPVEEFMYLYNLLLMLCDDSQRKVDRFIVNQDPDVPRTQQPEKNTQQPKTTKKTQQPKKEEIVMETIYTRLRNEFAHTRVGVDLATTKHEMVNRLGGLLALVGRAIELSP